MTKMDQVLNRAVELDLAPFVVATVGDADKILWSGGAGQSTVSTDAGLDTMFRIFSSTKSIGSAAAMILVDRDLISLDTPVNAVLPEFDDLQVLDGIGPDGDLVLRPPRTTCTLRHLLTHTSGLAYETFNEKQMAFHRLPGSPHILHGTRKAFNYHLMFDPGADFSYGIGIDWAGLLVEAVDGRPIDQFCQEEIFAPLNMLDTVFEVDEARRARMADIRRRTDDGGFEIIHHEAPSRPEVYGMGHALFSTAPDYLRFLRMILNLGELDGYRVLKDETARLMLQSQTGDIRVPPFRTLDPPLSADVDFFPGVPMTWTAGFLRNEVAIPARRAAGSLTWAGILNTHYWLDPVNGIAGVFMTQLAPFCDAKFLDAYASFETTVYAELPTLLG